MTGKLDAPSGGTDGQPVTANLDNIIVVLNEPQNVVNVAGAIRAMMNMGLSRLHVVEPCDFDPYRIHGIAHRSEDLVERTRIFDTLAEAVAECTFLVGTSARPRTAHRNYVRPRDIAPSILDHAGHGTVGILFGREDRGLPNDALDHCNAVAIVPTDPEYSSLNLAQACLLVCYEIYAAALSGPDALPRGKRVQGPATKSDLEEMFAALEGGLGRMAFFKGSRSPESVLRTLRTLLNRAELDLSEARLVRAIGFEICHALDRAEQPPDS